jgi:malate synthase
MAKASESLLSAQAAQVTAPVTPEYSRILTSDALAFVAALQREFGSRREALLRRRAERQAEFDAGRLPDFLPETADVRAGDWRIAPFPPVLEDRRVEITGPVERKMIINALNSGANVFMADFEDSLTPTWDNVVQGQINLRDAVDGSISYVSPDGKRYALKGRIAILFVRPRGWHLIEKHVLVDGQPVSGSLFDFALYFFHNARTLAANGRGPFFYLPKMEGHLEARLWNDVFNFAERTFGLAPGTIKATVLIETILAAFEMDEILYELREHSAGLNCGRWDYIFSCIKKFRNRPGFILADRGLITMTVPFMHAYSLLAIKTCHRRGAHAMGGMAAQIPIKDDPVGNDEALARVRADKQREVSDGHDGTWVAHPGLVGLAREAFDAGMPSPNQIARQRDDVHAGAADLLAFGPERPITEDGLRHNLDVGLQYLGSWLAGTGCVPIHHLMEDAATAEISRAQVWQWIRSSHGVLDDGRKVTIELFRTLLPEELARVRQTLGEKQFAAGRYEQAAQVLERLTVSDEFAEFLTLPCYDLID